MSALAVDPPSPAGYPQQRPPTAPRTGIWRCGFCASGLHRSCPGAVRGLRGQLVLCHCCKARPRCLDCNVEHSDDNPVDLKTWACIDQSTCRARIQHRLEQAPLYRMLQQCKVSAVNTRRLARREAERIAAGVPAGYNDDSYIDQPIPSRTSKKARTPGKCECCGVPTKGGRFAVGHDAKLKSRLFKAARDGDDAACKELLERGWVSSLDDLKRKR